MRNAFCSLMLVCLSLCSTQALANNLEQIQLIQLPSLTDKTTIELRDYRDKYVLLNFFAPRCTWCHKQMKAFGKVKKHCSDKLQPLSVGVNGNKTSLKKELRRAKVTYPAVFGTHEFTNQIGEIQGTPMTLIISPQGKLLAKLQGYLTFKQLQSYFPELCEA